MQVDITETICHFIPSAGVVILARAIDPCPRSTINWKYSLSKFVQCVFGLKDQDLPLSARYF